MKQDYADRERKKGTAELLVLALLAERQSHGYELAKLIEQRSQGALVFQVPSLYPLLYRLEKRSLITGRWVEKPGERRRRFYQLTARGRQHLHEERRAWQRFVQAVELITLPDGSTVGEIS